MTSGVLSPRESGKFIAEHAQFVSIDKAGIEKLGNKIIHEITAGKMSVKHFSHMKMHPKSTEPFAVNWWLVMNSLNFCFWSRRKQSWTVDSQTGYFALCQAIRNAEKSIDIAQAYCLADISENDVKRILQSDNNVDIQLFDERVAALRQVGKVLMESFDGSFSNVIQHSDKSAKKLLELIVRHFESFRDEATYTEQKVSFYKRAQILIADIWTCFEGEGIGEFHDIDELTMFADYRVPQSLLYFGVFVYDQRLLDRLKSNENLPNGHPMEVEIRGCSIHAVELIKAYVNEKLADGMKTNAILIDYFLWNFRRDHAKEIEEMKLPIHKTCCIYY